MVLIKSYKILFSHVPTNTTLLGHRSQFKLQKFDVKFKRAFKKSSNSVEKTGTCAFPVPPTPTSPIDTRRLDYYWDNQYGLIYLENESERTFVGNGEVIKRGQTLVINCRWRTMGYKLRRMAVIKRWFPPGEDCHLRENHTLRTTVQSNANYKTNRHT